MARVIRLFFTYFLVPAVLYAATFYSLTYPLLHSFNARFFCGEEDGYQNIWNLWWLNKSIGELGRWPWHTTWLHYPEGTSLLAHTLCPINALFAVPMLRAGFALHQVYNTIVVFSFVMTGVTTFWLARRVTGSYGGALFAGAAFTFCHFHFAHAQNHLQMTELQWLPLAILAVYELLTRPTVWKGAAAAVALLAVALTDFHLTFYAAVAGAVLGAVVTVRLYRGRFADARRYAWPVSVFLLLSGATTGVLAWRLLALNRADPLTQNHDPTIWSTDVVDLVIPGAEWRFNAWTKPVWSRLAKPHEAFAYAEHSLYLGWVVIGLCAWAVRRRGAIRLENRGYWFGLIALFGVLSLGPWLHVAGWVTWAPGAYRVLEWAFPPLKMGGVPMRMMAVVLLVGAVVAGAGLADLVRVLGSRARWVVPLILLAWAFETLPKAQPTTATGYPQWVRVLRDLPDGAVIDTTYKGDMFRHLYCATGHGKPVGEGYISRYPLSVERRRGRVRQLVDEGRFDELRREFGFRYLVIPPGAAPAGVPGRVVWEDGEMRIYDLSSE